MCARGRQWVYAGRVYSASTWMNESITHWYKNSWVSQLIRQVDLWQNIKRNIHIRKEYIFLSCLFDPGIWSRSLLGDVCVVGFEIFYLLVVKFEIDQWRRYFCLFSSTDVPLRYVTIVLHRYTFNVYCMR